MLALAAASSLLALVLAAKMVHLCWRIGQQNDMSPTFPRLAGLVERDLPKNAVLLFDQRYKLEYIIAMFWIDRTAYPLGSGNWNQITRAVRSHGGIPFIVSSQPLPLPPVLTDLDEGVVVYAPRGHDLTGFSALVPVNLKIGPAVPQQREHK